jgi:hypothetical protein
MPDCRPKRRKTATPIHDTRATLLVKWGGVKIESPIFSVPPVETPLYCTYIATTDPKTYEVRKDCEEGKTAIAISV